MEDVPQSLLETEKWIVNNQWVVDEKIASGGFGAVYRGHDIHDSNEVVAVKTEKRKNKQNYVDKEVQVYRMLGTSKGFPRLRWTGKTIVPDLSGNSQEDRSCYVIVMDLLGPSLSDLFYKNQKYYSLRTVLILADQMLERLETLHEKGIVHRDIKPGNFVMGRGAYASTVYLIDFGLAHKYRNSAGTHIRYEDNVPFRGTHRYASVNAHMKIEQTRRDDLESLGYVLIYFLKGTLPWQNLNVDRNHRRQVIGDMKRNTSIQEITSTLPAEFSTYLAYVRNLQFQDKPDYKMLHSLFRKCYADQKFPPTDRIYDWSSPQGAVGMETPVSTKKVPKSVEILDGSEHIEIIDYTQTTPPHIKTTTTTKKKRKASQSNSISTGTSKKSKKGSTKTTPPSTPKATPSITTRTPPSLRTTPSTTRSTSTRMTLRPRRRNKGVHNVIEISDDSGDV